ncbi:hypothetical protein JXM67_13445 [candidate division WOR-3 bacterium]|nr:hypothetical protein [candidate division WOR-3 bacterium]
MSWVFSILAYAAPLLSWGDSLYLDQARLGSVSRDEGKVSWCQCIFTDITVAVLEDESGYSLGLRPVPLAEQRPIETFLEGAAVQERPNTTAQGTSGYWLRGLLYDASLYAGPWDEIDVILGRLSPTNYVKVTETSSGGTEAVYGTLYLGSAPAFRSEAGTYQLSAPSLTDGANELLLDISGNDTTVLETQGVKGILYLQAGFPLFFFFFDCG